LLPDHSYCLSTQHHRYTFIQNAFHTFPLIQFVLGNFSHRKIGRGMKLTIYFHLVLRLKMCGAITPIPRLPSWHHRDNVTVLKIHTFSGATYWYIILACTFNTVFHSYLLCYNLLINSKWLRWSRGSVLAFGTQVRGFAPGRSRWIFRAKKSSARLPSEGK
jgi:hypothetical protein